MPTPVHQRHQAQSLRKLVQAIAPSLHVTWFLQSGLRIIITVYWTSESHREARTNEHQIYKVQGEELALETRNILPELYHPSVFGGVMI